MFVLNIHLSIPTFSGRDRRRILRKSTRTGRKTTECGIDRAESGGTLCGDSKKIVGNPKIFPSDPTDRSVGIGFWSHDDTSLAIFDFSFFFPRGPRHDGQLDDRLAVGFCLSVAYDVDLRL
ncbi:hypothetical protein GWI33_001546 [Rhynchophorus ferrugineus]|uniref:Uncharacterized protein n=1 Tax=Rhynchophorus ferrugineus TaxID=354439 RepID=A0A834INE2_RHYFE|nr:hypothetical protein GWI33_001546 [Rhynchophorus ferrugineus]